jgi:hypothetical protein
MITYFSNQTEESKNNMTATQQAGGEKAPIGLGIYFADVSSWSSNSSSDGSDHSDHSNHSIKTESSERDTYEEKLSRYRKFFDNGPLMRCLDKDDKQPATDLLFNALLTDVQQNQLNDENYRGVVQIRSFWDDVRKQLRSEDEAWVDFWPEGYPRYPPDEAECSDRHDYYASYRWTMFGQQEFKSQREYQEHQVCPAQNRESKCRGIHEARIHAKTPPNGNFRTASNTYSQASRNHHSRTNHNGSLFR